MTAQGKDRDLLAEIVDAAKRHGRASDPEHEVGDLEDALNTAWRMLTPEQKLLLHREHFQDHDAWLEEDT